ncbi:hypothetical protein B0T25DRAFT_354394 [Lasiosphaeria hispida]|uniref:C2H2-type domain-containing protein n=1 Tax=Lasiosphaeria hispida TaxID=260671 RepID=A0AAJ0M8N5_9PEZI|nr:hypothetical protein B0T25DRAFT_354394 [Lasiosphaeria hispida]
MEDTPKDRLGGSKIFGAREELRAKAPLAAQFEDCAQAIRQLHTALNADSWVSKEELATEAELENNEKSTDESQSTTGAAPGQDSELEPQPGSTQESTVDQKSAEQKESEDKKKALRILVDRCLARLISWGHDTGAVSRLLDHSLRRALKPRSSALTLLKELWELAVNATESLPTAFDGFGERPAGDLVEQLPTAALTPPSEQRETQEIRDILGLGDQDSNSSPEKFLAEAEEIINDLFDLQPTLLDPFDDDDLAPIPDALQTEASDRQYVQKVFPKAVPSLVDRLVAANRRRRQNIQSLREEASKARREGETSPLEAAATGQLGISRERKPRHGTAMSRIRGYRKTSTPSGSETGASKTAPSTLGRTTFSSSDIIHEKESVTSFASTDDVHTVQPQLEPPGPPADISLKDNLPFQCQYCRVEVPLELGKQSMSQEDWIAHFYMDLQPYTCTFEECSRAHKLFGVKQDWFQHELDYHRTHQAWYCAKPECKTEFQTWALFQQHLKSEHPDIRTDGPDLKALAQAWQRLSLQPEPSPQRECPLCGSPYKDSPADWRDHIAYHQEQFSLLAIGEDEGGQASEDEAIDPNEYVTTYLAGQKKLEGYAAVPPSGPPLAPVTVIQRSVKPAESNDILEILDESSGDLGDSGGERRDKRRVDTLWEAKVGTYLREEPGEDLEADQPLPSDSAATVEPSWLNVPERNHEFVGRDNDLQHLNDFISQSGHICVVSGRGGIGKTATAIEYARRYEPNFSGVIWIEAENPNGLAERYNTIGTSTFKLGLEGQDPISFMMNVRAKLGSWDRRWLLIFDNVEAWEDVSKYIPRNLPKTRGSVLITTRQQSLVRTDTPALQRVLHRIELDPLTPEEAGQFLICSINPKVVPEDVPNHPDYDLAIQIGDLVERLPLALIMIAGYSKVSRAALDDFLEIWEEKMAFRAKQTQRNKSVVIEGGLDSSIDLLWDIGISELSVPARNLLEILAFLDPENIQKDLLVGDHTEGFLEFLNSTEAALYKRMIRHISGRKLIDVRGEGDTESYRIHRLLQTKIVIDIGAQLKFDSAMTKATRLVRKRFPKSPPIQAPAPENWKRCKEYMPHVFGLLRAFNYAQNNFRGFEQTEEMADLFYDAGFFIWDSQANVNEGLDFLDAAESILDSDDIKADPDSSRRADILCMSGLLLNGMGCEQRVKCLQKLEHALQIRKRIYDAAAPNITRDQDVLLQNAACDYAILLLNEYKFEEATVIFEDCLRHYKLWDTEDKIPFEYSKYYYNMGIVHMCQENLDKAVEFLQHSVELAEAAFGKEGQYWDNFFMLACAVRQMGDFQRALDMHLEALRAKLEQKGKHSNATILSTYAVGEMYAMMDDLPAAIDYLERCIELATASNWPGEALGRAQLHLARLYKRQGVSLQEAEEQERKAEEALGRYLTHAAKWVAEIDEPIMIFDDLLPTDEGRYTGTLLLRVLWGRRKGEKTVTLIWHLKGGEITVPTGL